MINYNLGGYYMKHTAKVKIGDCVQFSYRKNPSLQLTGYVIGVLTNFRKEFSFLKRVKGVAQR